MTTIEIAKSFEQIDPLPQHKDPWPYTVPASTWEITIPHDGNYGLGLKTLPLKKGDIVRFDDSGNFKVLSLQDQSPRRPCP